MKTTRTTRRTVLQAALTASALALGLPALAQQQGPGVTDKEIRLGTWIPLTGPLASYGIPYRAGIDAAVGAVNAAGGIKGRKINMIVEDNAYNPQRTVAAARKLISRDEVLAIGMPFGAVTASAFDYVLGEAKVPMLNSWGSQIDWFFPPRPGFFGAMVLYESQARTIGRWLVKDGAKSAVVIHSALAGFENVAKMVEPGARSASATAKVEMMPTKFGTTDYSPIALDVVKKNPEAVVMILAQGEMVAASKELRQQGYKGALYTYSPGVVNSVLELGGPALEGLKAIGLTTPVEANTPAINAYKDAMAKYAPSEKPDYVSLIGYALTLASIEGLRRVEGPITRDSLNKAMYTIRNYDTGIFPALSYAPDRHLGVTSVQRVVAQKGKWASVGTPVEAEKDW
ncbi:MAG: ABC transporter substrate-binding protein [Pseudomonadota bacterium]